MFIFRPVHLQKTQDVGQRWQFTGIWVYNPPPRIIGIHGTTRRRAAFGSTGHSNPTFGAASMIHCSGSMAKIKSNRDNGSPCLKPLAWLILSQSSLLIQLRHFCPKLIACRTSIKYAQFKESKALEMSSLMNRASLFFAVQALDYLLDIMEVFVYAPFF